MQKRLFMLSKRGLFLLLVFFLAGLPGGCSKVKINARNAETYQKSLQEMRQSLSVSKRSELDEAIEKIFNHERRRATEYGSGMGEAGIMLLLDELTADEIIAKAKSIKKK